MKRIVLIALLGLFSLISPDSGNCGPQFKITNQRITVEKAPGNPSYHAIASVSVKNTGNQDATANLSFVFAPDSKLKCKECKKGERWESQQLQLGQALDLPAGKEKEFKFSIATLKADLPAGKIPSAPSSLRWIITSVSESGGKGYPEPPRR
jgi:hypothetical protein